MAKFNISISHSTDSAKSTTKPKSGPAVTGKPSATSKAGKPQSQAASKPKQVASTGGSTKTSTGNSKGPSSSVKSTSKKSTVSKAPTGKAPKMAGPAVPDRPTMPGSLSAVAPGDPASTGIGEPKVTPKAPKSIPTKEPTATPQVLAARQITSNLLKSRQKKEMGLGDTLDQSSRQNDAGSGYWIGLSPEL